MELRRTPRRYPRFVLSAVYALEDGLRRLGGRRFYARTLRAAAVREVEIALPRLPAALDGFTIVQLSDLHAGPYADARSLAPVLARTDALAPDLICLTGDYITHRIDEALALADLFASLRARCGVVAVFGNHDYRERREGELVDALSGRGVEFLRNSGRAIESGGARLFVAGIEDVEEGKVVDLDAALADRRDGDFTILLSHHPDTALRLEGKGVDLVLSGHTHGGQIKLLGRSVFGGSLRSRFERGLFRIGSTSLFVTTGLGVLVLPLRVGARPEIAKLVLRRAGMMRTGDGAREVES